MPGDPNHYARLLLGLVPDNVKKSVGQAELLDRVAESQRLSARASDPALSPVQRREAKERAQQVMRAAPRAVVEKEVAEKIAKAAQLGESSEATALRRHAQRLLAENPPAPRRGAAVRKAAEKEQPVVVFDQNGTVVGICDPADITPVQGRQATPAAPAAVAGEPVAKNARLSVWDGYGRRFVTTRGKIRKTAEPRPGVYDSGPLRAVLGGDTGYGTGVASPEEQARNRGPVRAGGTTGMGQPRRTGPAAALPGDGPQQALPGDLEARTIIKSLGPDWRMMRDSRGRLTGAVRQADIRPARPGAVLKGASARAWTPVCNSAGQQVGVAPVASVIALADLRAAGRVAKAMRSRP